MDDILLVPFAILYTIIRRTQLQHFDIGKSWMIESLLENRCHVVEVIGHRASYESWISAREHPKRINWRHIDSAWRRIHFRTRQRHRTRLSSGETKCRIHMVDEEDISIVTNCMDEVIDSFAEGRTIACMSDDSEIRTCDLDTRGERQDSSMETVYRREAYFV